MGLNELVWGDELEYGTVVRCVEQETLFSHTRPDGSSWWTADADHLYGEVLGRGFYTSASIVEGWVNSPGHYAVLTGNYRTCCVVYYYTEGGQCYWAAEFGY